MTAAPSSAAMILAVVVVIVVAMVSTAALVAIGRLDPAVFGAVVTGAITGTFALVNPQYPRPPAAPPVP